MHNLCSPRALRRRQCFLCPLLLLVLSAWSAAGWALSMVERTFDELVAHAELIVVGTVAEQSSRWRDPVAQDMIDTFYTLSDLEVLKGSADGETYVLRMAGGVIPPYSLTVPGAPQLQVGERYVLFIKDNGRAIFPLVGVQQGIYQILNRDSAQPTVATLDGRAVTAINQQDLVEGRAKAAGAPEALSLARFKSAIARQLQAAAHDGTP